MSRRDESAFPIVANLAMDPRIEEAGLTKRELFAAIALHSLLSDPHQPNWNKTNYARQAVDYADLLLEALAGDPP